MRGKATIYAIYRYWVNHFKGKGISNREVGRQLDICHTTIAKWVSGIEPARPQTDARLLQESRRKRKVRKMERNEAINMSVVDLNKDYGYEYSFSEIAIKLNLTDKQVKICYLNATRKIKIILERKGVDIGLIPERLEELDHQF